MICNGSIYCKIYRDKRYCQKEHPSHNWQPCNCRHAAMKCDVEYCELSDRCLIHKKKVEDAWQRECFGEFRNGDD